MSSVNIYKSKTYCLVSAFSADANELAITVEHLLVEGWVLTGGISASNSMLSVSYTHLRAHET